MTREELREKVARALCYADGGDKSDPDAVTYYYEHADAAIALVRRETLEEAAKVARGFKDNLEECGEYDTGYDDGRDDAAAAIRAIGKD